MLSQKERNMIHSLKRGRNMEVAANLEEQQNFLSSPAQRKRKVAGKRANTPTGLGMQLSSVSPRTLRSTARTPDRAGGLPPIPNQGPLGPAVGNTPNNTSDQQQQEQQQYQAEESRKEQQKGYQKFEDQVQKFLKQRHHAQGRMSLNDQWAELAGWVSKYSNEHDNIELKGSADILLKEIQASDFQNSNATATTRGAVNPSSKQYLSQLHIAVLGVLMERSFALLGREYSLMQPMLNSIFKDILDSIFVAAPVTSIDFSCDRSYEPQALASEVTTFIGKSHVGRIKHVNKQLEGQTAHVKFTERVEQAQMVAADRLVAHWKSYACERIFCAWRGEVKRSKERHALDDRLASVSHDHGAQEEQLKILQVSNEDLKKQLKAAESHLSITTGKLKSYIDRHEEMETLIEDLKKEKNRAIVALDRIAEDNDVGIDDLLRDDAPEVMVAVPSNDRIPHAGLARTASSLQTTLSFTSGGTVTPRHQEDSPLGISSGGVGIPGRLPRSLAAMNKGESPLSTPVEAPLPSVSSPGGGKPTFLSPGSQQGTPGGTPNPGGISPGGAGKGSPSLLKIQKASRVISAATAFSGASGGGAGSSPALLHAKETSILSKAAGGNNNCPRCKIASRELGATMLRCQELVQVIEETMVTPLYPNLGLTDAMQATNRTAGSVCRSFLKTYSAGNISFVNGGSTIPAYLSLLETMGLAGAAVPEKLIQDVRNQKNEDQQASKFNHLLATCFNLGGKGRSSSVTNWTEGDHVHVLTKLLVRFQQLKSTQPRHPEDVASMIKEQRSYIQVLEFLLDPQR